MDEDKTILEQAIQNAFQGTEENGLGTEERKQASDELRDFMKIDLDDFKAKDQSKLEWAKLEAEKEKAKRDADIEREKIKADNKREGKNFVIRIAQIVGIVGLSGLALITDSENWVGKGCNKVASDLQRRLKL